MDRQDQELPGGVIRRVCRCQSATERDQWRKRLPLQCPPGYHLSYRWIDDMAFEWGLEPDAAAVGGAGAPAVDYTGLSLAELRTKAAERGITVPKTVKTPLEVIALLQAADRPAVAVKEDDD